MKERNVWLILVMVLAAACTVQAVDATTAVIDSVVRAGGAEGDRDVIGEYFSYTTPLIDPNGIEDANSLIFSDRTYLFSNTPAELVNAEYIMTFNSDKEEDTVTYTVTTNALANIFIAVDDRHAAQAVADGIVEDFAAAGEFQDIGLNVHINESESNPARPLSVFAAPLAAGTYEFHGQPNSNNFYIIGVLDLTFDPLPVVDAGPGAAIWLWPDPSIVLDGSISDLAPVTGGGALTWEWTQTAGTAVTIPAGEIDPEITFPSGGTYEFTLSASDDGGTTTVEDTVTFTFKVYGVDKQTVLLVSAVPNDPGHAEEPLIAWLEELGYLVDTAGMGQAFGEDDNALNSGDDGHPAFLAATANADIIFFSVSCKGQEYDGDGGEHIWNEIPVPLITQSAQMTEGDNSSGDTTFGWTLEDSRGDDDFDEMRLLPDFDRVRLWDFTDATNRANVVMIESMPIADGGVIRATADGNSRPFWIEFPAGTNFDLHHDTVEPGRYGIAAADRVFFGAYEYAFNDEGGSATRGPNGGKAYWDSFILPVYKDTLQQILFDLAPDPTFNPAPEADAGPSQVIYADETMTVTLAGTVTDEDPVVGDPGTLTSYWTMLSGPGTVTFTPNGGINDLVSDATFTAAGDYELLLQASDGDKDANDIVVIEVLEKQLVGHWPFDVDALDYGENAEQSDGTLEQGAFLGTDATIGDGSLNTINDNPNDPNLPHVDLGPATELDFSTNDWTVCAWVKTTQSGTGDANKGTIFANGGDSGGGHRYGLILREQSEGNVTLITDDDNKDGHGDPPYGKNQARTITPVNDGLWRFVVGMRDGTEIRIYRDGILENIDQGTEPVPADYDLSGTSQLGSKIGIIWDWNGSAEASTLYKRFSGLIDDVRVYNYALSDVEMAALAVVGPIVANVNAGPATEVFPWKLGPPDRLMPLNGVVTDMGANSEANTILWTTESVTGTIDPEAEATFTPADAAETTATFPEAGVYVLKLTVVDPDAGEPVSDTIEVTVLAPTCAEVIADGLGMPGDIAGGGLLGDEPDCYVNLVDLVAILANWIECNVPLDEECDWPF